MEYVISGAVNLFTLAVFIAVIFVTRSSPEDQEAQDLLDRVSRIEF